MIQHFRGREIKANCKRQFRRNNDGRKRSKMLAAFIFLSRARLFRVQVDGDDEAVETEDLRENENENHADEESGLLCGPADSGVSDDADGVTGSEAGQTDGQAGTQMNESPENCHVKLDQLNKAQLYENYWQYTKASFDHITG